jgi:hypothetical protein
VAITISVLAASTNTTITTTPQTVAITAGANKLLLAFACLVNGTTGRTCLVTGSGLTFTKNEGLYDTNSNSLSIHKCVTGGGGFSGNLTFTQNNSIQQMHWCVVEVSGYDTTTPVPQVTAIDVRVNSDFPASLGSPVDATNSRSFIVAAHNTFQNSDGTSNVTILADLDENSPAQSFTVGWSDTAWEGTPNISYGTSSAGAAMACEVAPAASGTLFTENKGGAITPAGATTLQALRMKTLTGAITSAGAAGRIKSAFRTLGGTVTSTGIAARVAARTLTGALSFSGALGLQKTRSMSLSGAFTPTGTISRIKSAILALAGSLTSSATLLRQGLRVKSLSAAIAPSGLLVRISSKALAASLSPSALISSVKLRAMTLTGAVNPNQTTSGAGVTWDDGTSTWNDATATWNATSGFTSIANVSFLVQYVRSGALSPAAVAARSASKALVADIAPFGAMAKLVSRPLVASLSFVGTASKAFLRTLAGLISPSATIEKAVARTRALSGAINSTSALIRDISLVRAGELGLSGAITTGGAVRRSFAGALTSSGAIQRSIQVVRSGEITPSATIAVVRNFARILSGTLTSSGFLGKVTTFSRVLAGSLSPSGALQIVGGGFRFVAGTIAPVGNAIFAISKSLTGQITPSGVAAKTMIRSRGGTLAPTAVISSLVGLAKALSGVLTPAGAVSRSTAILRAGAIAPVGVLARAWSRVTNGAVTLSGFTLATRLRLASLAGSLTSSGVATRLRTVAKSLGGNIGPVGAQIQSRAMQLLAGLHFAGLLVKVVFRGEAETVELQVSFTTQVLLRVIDEREATLEATTIRSQPGVLLSATNGYSAEMIVQDLPLVPLLTGDS